MATTLTRDGGGSGGVAVDTSFIFHPTTHRVPACPRSLPSLFAFCSSLTAWRHLGHSHSLLLLLLLFLFVPLSFFPSRSAAVSIARGNPDSTPPLSSFPAAVSLCFSYFSSPSSFHSACPLCPPTSPPPRLSPLYFFSFVLIVGPEYFGNYSARFYACCFVLECNVLYSRRAYSSFRFRSISR